MTPLQPGASPLTPALRATIDAWWRAANYLSVGQIYLFDNPLLKRPLAAGDIKHMLLGHWGTTPGQNFIYAHLNRAITKYDLDMIYVSGPGHGGPAVVASTYLEGSYSEIYPDISRDEAGLQRLFKQFSFPGGIPSHASPETPGSIHEGGELGYSLSHSFGAVFDNPGLVVACVIGDGEAETGPLATAWHSNKFLDAANDGAVLPILHLNGYKISNPTLLARIPREELTQLLHGYGWEPLFVEGHEPEPMHDAMAATLDACIERIHAIQHAARHDDVTERPRWPMIVLASPKGWTGPKEVDGLKVEGTFRAHQVPLSDPRANPAHLGQLEAWLQSYRPQELFHADGRLKEEIAALAPAGARRMGANPHANGGLLLRELHLPAFRDYAVDVPRPGTTGIGDTHVLGKFIRDVIALNEPTRNFRLFGPDETLSNGLEAVFEKTERQWEGETVGGDEFLARAGRVIEVLSEHQCEGWLEGYLLTGRHGLFNCYEAFIHIVDSMFNQHAKWLKVTAKLPWRAKIASLNYLLASHVWRQDHNGFTHQDPGFIDHVMNKKPEVVRVYLPPDANCLLSVMDHCLRSRHYVNVVIAGAAMAHDGPGRRALRRGHRHLGLGRQRGRAVRHRPRRGDGLLRRRADAGGDGRRQAAARAAAAAEGARRQRGRPVPADAAFGTSARARRARVRRAVHQGQAGDLRVPCLPVADPPAHLSPHQPRQLPRARLQGGGHDHHGLRHDRAQRTRPFPPRDGRHRPAAADRRTGSFGQADTAGETRRAQAVHRCQRTGSAGDPQLELEQLT